jgi:hypothetical protein
MFLVRRKLFLALRNAATEPVSPISQMMKPEANGNATRWQGYVALDGFGITLTKNHISAKNPVMDENQNHPRCFAGLSALSLLENSLLLFKENNVTPAP